MNKILKSQLLDFLCHCQAEGFELEWSQKLLQGLQRKRGRIKGSKHPKKKAILSSVADELCYTDGSLPHLSTP
jgi:hypothetical protein